MTESSDEPSILWEKPNMQRPIEGMAYPSPLNVAGKSDFGSGGLKQGETHVVFWLRGENKVDEQHQYRNEEGNFSFGQTLEPGPWELHLRHKWWWSSGDSGEASDWYDTGFFYILTPPQTLMSADQ